MTFPLDDAANIKALERALIYLRYQAESECNAMCGCEVEARVTLREMAEILSVTVDRLGQSALQVME